MAALIRRKRNLDGLLYKSKFSDQFNEIFRAYAKGPKQLYFC